MISILNPRPLMRGMANRVVALVVAPMLLVGAWAAPAAADTFSLTSLDWPPYSGKDLPEGGLSVKVARAAFEAMGHDMAVVFLPWQRAVAMGLGEGYVGYFPEYYSEDLAADSCAFSEPMGSGSLGFVEPVSAPVSWETLDDLADRSIGTVAGYVNTAAFDERVAAGLLTVQTANDDLTNIRKVARGRIEMAVIDANVLDWLLSQNPDLAGQVQMNDRRLEDKKLYVCFQKSEAGDAAREIFNQGLTKIDVPTLMMSHP